MTFVIIFSAYLVWCVATGTMHAKWLGRRGLVRIRRNENPRQFWWMVSIAGFLDLLVLVLTLLHV